MNSQSTTIWIVPIDLLVLISMGPWNDGSGCCLNTTSIPAISWCWLMGLASNFLGYQITGSLERSWTGEILSRFLIRSRRTPSSSKKDKTLPSLVEKETKKVSPLNIGRRSACWAYHYTTTNQPLLFHFPKSTARPSQPKAAAAYHTRWRKERAANPTQLS